MPKKQSTAAKKACRAARQGAKYTPALRQHHTPRTATARLTPGERGALDMSLDGHTRSVYNTDSLRNSLSWTGWDIVPGQDPQDLFPDGGQLQLIRSKRGMLEDQATELWGTVPFHKTADAYALAVVSAIRGRGGRIADWDVHVDTALLLPAAQPDL